MSKPPIWVIAHRGASGYAPENTLVAVRRALELGADAIECDVHLSRDGVPIVFHDEETDRMTGAAGRIAERTHAEISALSVGDLGPGSIPTLAEWLAELKGTHAVIEIKTDRRDYEGIEAAVHAAASEAGALAKSTFISFNLDTLDRLRALAPAARLGPIFEGRPGEVWERVRQLAPVTMVFDGRALDAEDIQRAKQSGQEAWAYTLNTEEHILQGADAGLTGIISNYPDRVFEVLGITPPPRKHSS